MFSSFVGQKFSDTKINSVKKEKAAIKIWTLISPILESYHLRKWDFPLHEPDVIKEN